MSDFAKIAADARAAHAAKIAAQNDQRAQERAARQKAVEDQIGLLDTYLFPSLDAAKTQLASEGIELEIERQFDVMNYSGDVPPTVKIYGKGPKRPGDGYQWETAAIVFEPVKQQLKVWAYESSYTRSGSKEALVSIDIASANADVELAVTRLVASYFQQLEQH